MLKHFMSPQNQKESKQTGQQHSKTSVNHDPRTHLRQQSRFDADEYYYPRHRILPQPLSYADGIGYLSVNTDTTPIQRFTLTTDKKTVEIKNLKDIYDNIRDIPAEDDAFYKFCSELEEVEPILNLEDIVVDDIPDNSINALRSNLDDLRVIIQGKLSNLELDGIAVVCKYIYINAHHDTTYLQGSDLKKFETVINTMFPQYGEFICNSFKKDGYLQFARAQFFHFGYDRTPSNNDAIDQNDIQECYDRRKSCVITALNYAEDGNVFGTKDIKTLHYVLYQHFSSYPGQDEETDENKKNNVWKNYSDDNVFPHIYEFFGYRSQKSALGIKDGDMLGTVWETFRSSKTKGIIIVDGHAIFFNAESPGRIELKDNSEPPKVTNAIRKENWNKSLLDVYTKKDINIVPKPAAPGAQGTLGKESCGSKSRKSVPGSKKKR